MRVPEGDLHCQCKLSIFSLSSFGPCIVFWILQKGTCIGKCIFSIFPAVTHQLKCKQTCIEKCRPRHKISMKKWLKIHQISKNVNLFPYITTNLHCGIIFAKEWLATIHYDFAPIPQRSCFANPKVDFTRNVSGRQIFPYFSRQIPSLISTSDR